jgi:hypothetical protein
VLTLIAVTLALTPSLVSAQDLVTPSSVASHLDVALFPAAGTPDTPVPLATAPHGQSRGVLVPLYVSFAVLQALDAHSTLQGIHGGLIEQNPMMRPIANRPSALLAVKAGVAASTILLADGMRGRSRVGAIVLMAGLNSLYATVVAHNYAAVR